MMLKTDGSADRDVFRPCAHSETEVILFNAGVRASPMFGVLFFEPPGWINIDWESSPVLCSMVGKAKSKSGQEGAVQSVWCWRLRGVWCPASGVRCPVCEATGVRSVWCAKCVVA